MMVMVVVIGLVMLILLIVGLIEATQDDAQGPP